MNTNAWKIVSLVTLCLVILPSLLHLSGPLSLPVVKGLALAGTLGWFVVTPMWMSRELPVDADQVEI